MKRLYSLLAFVYLTMVLSGCTPLAVQALHTPFYPSATQQVTFSAEAQSDRGVAEITIVQRTFERNGFCAAYVAGECVPLPTLSEKTLRTCPIVPATTPAHCDVTVGPFGDGSFVTYGARARDASGSSAGDLWIGFAVGVQPDPNEPIAVYVRDDSAKAIDIVMVPVDYNGAPGRTFRNFVDDSRQLIVDGYLAHPSVTGNRSKWNFYVNPVSGGLFQSSIGGTVKRSMTQPSNWTRIAAVADAAAYMHHNSSWRDFANFGNAGGIGQFTIQAGTPGTVFHETGHAVFGLSDEYCCDGGIINSGWPHDNMFASQPTCIASATAHGVPSGACVQLTAAIGFCGGVDASGNAIIGATNLQWRQDAAGDLLGCGGNAGAAAGVLDAARIRWYYDNL